MERDMQKIPVRAILVTLALVVLAGAVPGWAQEGITPPNTGLTDAEIDQRIQFIERRLSGSKTHGQIWYWSWMTVDAGTAVIEGAVAATIDNHDDKVNYATNAALGAIGVADLIFRPLEARYGAGPIQGMPDATRDEKVAKLRAAEDQLRRNAERAETRTSWVMHAGNAALATIAGVVVGFWGNPSDGVITGASALAGGELNIWTQPGAPEQDWKDYKAMASGRADLTKVSVYVSALPDGGAKTGLRFTW
jgi:hypothetical protein